MNERTGREQFQAHYQGQPPWDAGRPQPPFVAIADRVTGTLLDAGCGTGENALYFAARGHKVVGFDFIEAPLRTARQKAADRGIAAEFLLADAMELARWDRQFDGVLDCGLFHVFSDPEREVYVAGLKHVTRSQGRLYLMCFSDAEPGEEGPRRIAREEIMAAFADGWCVESIEATQFQINPHVDTSHFSAGGPQSWFAVVRRLDD